MSFPKNFYWGGATAAVQYEGGWNEGGRGPSRMDVTTAGSKDHPRYITYINPDGTTGYFDSMREEKPQNATLAVIDGYEYPNHDAADFYHHWKEDIALFSKMGMKMFRLSISWSRIYPTGLEDIPNQEGIDFYHQIFKELKKNGIEPLVTISHYDDPLALEEKFGWQEKEMIDYFVKYSETLFKEFHSQVKYWLTFNEINSAIMESSFIKDLPKEKVRKMYIKLHNQLVASAKVVKYAHEMYPDLKIGCMLAGLISYPLTCDPNDVLANQKKMQNFFYYSSDVMVRGKYPSYAKSIWKQHDLSEEFFLKDAKILEEGKVDYFTYSYYMTNCETTHENALKDGGGNLTMGFKNPYLKYSDWGWSIDPVGMRYSLNEIYDRYQIPIMIVENGIGTVDVLENGCIHDEYRIDYMKGHIKAMEEAIEDGVELIAYTSWGIVDLISNGTGELKKRYGVIYVDKEDHFKRYKKDSFYWYKKVIESNGENLD